MSTRRPFLLASLLLLAAPPVAAAQAPAAPAGCTYQTCALRVEPGLWSRRLVRGVSGEEVGRLGGFGERGVDVLLTGPDSAVYHARAYQHNSRTAGTLGLLGLVAYVVAAASTDNFRDTENFGATEAVALVSGFGFTVAGGVFATRAQRNLSRGIWWYNAALPR